LKTGGAFRLSDFKLPLLYLRRGLGGGGVVALDLLQNIFTDSIQIIVDIRIKKPNHLDIQSIQILSSDKVILHCIVGKMGISVKLNGQSLRGAIKIKDI
jgi:hypothetical protein